jgi:hypothetical protein
MQLAYAQRVTTAWGHQLTLLKANINTLSLTLLNQLTTGAYLKKASPLLSRSVEINITGFSDWGLAMLGLGSLTQSPVTSP